MKRLISMVLCVVILFAFTACSNDASTQSSKPTVSSETTTTPSNTAITGEPIEFVDEAFEAKVRKALNKPEGDITIEEAAVVKSLDLSNEHFDKKDGDIKNISDIKYFTALEELNISFNGISDLTPLAEIKTLRTLVFNGIKARDLSPLKDLKNMVCLVFCWNAGGSDIGFENLDALSNMKNLENIDAKNAGIKDISVLSNLTKLWDIQLCDNQITDITPLANLQNLRIVLLGNNPVTDFSPLSDVYENLEGKDFEIK